MAMNVGGSGNGPQADININPLIDILLTLIIVFMIVSQSVKSHGLDAEIPQPPAAHDTQVPPPDRTVVLEVKDSSGAHPRVLLNQHEIPWDQLRAQLFTIYTTRAERILFIKADDDLPFESVASVIDVARSDFADMKVGLITAKIETGD